MRLWTMRNVSARNLRRILRWKIPHNRLILFPFFSALVWVIFCLKVWGPFNDSDSAPYLIGSLVGIQLTLTSEAILFLTRCFPHRFQKPSEKPFRAVSALGFLLAALEAIFFASSLLVN